MLRDGTAIPEVSWRVAVGMRGRHTSTFFSVTLLARDDAGDAAENLRGFQRRRNIILVALCLPHGYAELQRAVDLALLHQVSPGDPLVAFGRSDFTRVDILGEVDLYKAERDALASPAG